MEVIARKYINPNDIVLGNRIQAFLHGPNTFCTGEIVYIHPRKRFFQVEFTLGFGSKIRESYCFMGPQY